VRHVRPAVRRDGKHPQNPRGLWTLRSEKCPNDRSHGSDYRASLHWRSRPSRRRRISPIGSFHVDPRREADKSHRTGVFSRSLRARPTIRPALVLWYCDVSRSSSADRGRGHWSQYCSAARHTLQSREWCVGREAFVPSDHVGRPEEYRASRIPPASSPVNATRFHREEEGGAYHARYLTIRTENARKGLTKTLAVA
jgi:hypothetical protein